MSNPIPQELPHQKTSLDQFPHYVVQKVQGNNSLDLEKDRRLRLKSDLRAAKFGVLREEYKERVKDHRSGNQAVLEFILELAWYGYEQLELKPQKDFNSIVENSRY